MSKSRDIAPTDQQTIAIHAMKRPVNELVHPYIAALELLGNENGVIEKQEILVRKRRQAIASRNDASH